MRIRQDNIMLNQPLISWASANLTLTTAVRSTPTAATSAATVMTLTAFGAKGDGVTDDRPANQAAITALVAKGGGVLRIPDRLARRDHWRAHPKRDFQGGPITAQI